MTVDIWIRDYNPPRCFQKKISGRGKHNVSLAMLSAINGELQASKYAAVISNLHPVKKYDVFCFR
jgi:hypothetical protein